MDGGAVYPVYIASKKTFVVDDNQALIMGIDKPSEVGNTNIWDDHKEEIIKQSGDAHTIIIFDNILEIQCWWLLSQKIYALYTPHSYPSI